ncbi:hypothetical protein [Rhizobium sp. NRK18]|uniref:hypothetical protein n=1 Tax=Rhizobium sp. NRK18 TaxID=2964667 RepID=UPI0021C39B16|nr:hypothetical protein [Rhizobium sp. NRK18]MCQ2003194.1 hypothetical protein [Rhizobium sp. NRK18]
MTRAHSPSLNPFGFEYQIMRERQRLARQWATACTILVVFGTALSPFVLGDQRNVMVILVAALAAPIIVLLQLPMGKDLVWSSIAMIYLLVAELVNGGTRNVSSLGYTGMFVLSYVAFCGTLYTAAVTRQRLLRLLRQIIFAYAIVSVLQMICSHVGLPVPNHILSKGSWSYNSLAVEPSHAARILAFTLLSYLILQRRGGPVPSLAVTWRQNRLVIMAFSVSVLLTGSSLAIAILPLTIVMSLRLRWIVTGFGLLALSWPFLQTVELESIHRLVAFMTALPSLDIMAMVQADHSGALRVMPLILFLQTARIGDLSVWFGGGYDAITYYVQGHLIGVAKDVAVAGFIPGYVMISGLVGTALFCHAYLFRFLNRDTLPLILLWCAVLSNSAWNSQVFWYSLVLLRAVHHFSQPPASSLRTFSGRLLP